MKMIRLQYIALLVIIALNLSSTYAQDNSERKLITAKWRDSLGQVVKERQVIVPRVTDSSMAWTIDRTRYFMNGKQGLAALDGTVITEPIYDFIYAEHADGTAGYQIGDKRGILNWRTGKQITPPVYVGVSRFSEGLAAVTPDGSQWGFIDTTGTMVIAPQWNYASEFQDGVAKVVSGEDANRIGYLGPMDVFPTPGKAGYINKHGEYVIPLDYSYISTHTNSDNGFLRFTNGQYICEDPNGWCENPYPESKWGIMDIRGSVLIPDNEYDFIFPLYVIEDHFLFGVEKDKKYGVIDPNNLQVVVPLSNYSNIKTLTRKAKKAITRR